MPWGRGRARLAAAEDSQPAGPRTPPHTPRGRPRPDRCPSQFVGVSGCGCDDRFCVCGCRGHTAAVASHATGSTPPGPVPLPVCRRQWRRLRRQVLRLRLPRLYSGGGPTRHGVDPSRTGTPPSLSASVAAAATTGSASAVAAAIQRRWRRDCLAAFWLLIFRPFSRGAHVVEAWLVPRASAITALALSALSRITTDRKISQCFLFSLLRGYTPGGRTPTGRQAVAACDPARHSDLPVGSSPPPRPQPRPFLPFTPPPFSALTTPEGPVQGVPSPAARRRHALHGLAHLSPAGVGTSLGRRVAAHTAGCADTRHQAVAAPAATASHRGRGAVVPTVVEAGVAAAVAPQAPCTV